MWKLGRVLKKTNKELSFTAGVLLAIFGLVSIIGVGVSQVSATGTDCDNNAMIKCGYSTSDDLIAKIKNNDSGNGHKDLQSMYAGFGLTSADYTNFKNNAVQGTVYRDGRIMVGDMVVANNAVSFGRLESYHEPNAIKKTIGGITYYGNTVNNAFAAGVDSLPMYALFDAQGNLKIALITSCGNPSYGNNVHTSASCKMLTKTPVSGKLNTYNFTASGNTTGNAKIVQYVYDFGDGSTPVKMTNGTTPVQHTYTKAGTFTATVTEYASVPGNSKLQLTVVSDCKKTITVTMPFGSCMQLVGAILDKSKMSYSFTVTATFGNGETFTGADFDFGDGKTQTGVKPTTSTTVVVNHTYAAAGNYNASATLHFMVNGKAVTAPTCKALVTPETVTPECKPGVPVGSPACIPPCQPGSSVPPESAECTPPTLPNTGAGNTIAIFTAVVIAGFLVYRQLLFRKHRAAFVAAQEGSSPLPLADPLNGDAPLAGTPFATAKQTRSLRRKRHL